MAQTMCQHGSNCLNRTCHAAHPPGHFVCDFGSLCFIAGCPGAHPNFCNGTCTNIRGCNKRHVQACSSGANCTSDSCNLLHPPPCSFQNCTDPNCPFAHPHQPKYQTILSFNTSHTPGKSKHKGGQHNPNQPFQQQSFPGSPYQPSPSNYPQSYNNPNQNYNPKQTYQQTDHTKQSKMQSYQGYQGNLNPSPQNKFNKPCRHGQNCRGLADGSCPYQH